MSVSINKIILVGNVGRDPEIRTTQDGKEIASLVIATSETWKDKNTGERKERTEWHRVAIFSEGLVNVVKNYVKKGMRLYLEGSVHTRKWMDSNNQERYTTEVVLQGFQSNLIMLDRAGNSTTTASGHAELKPAAASAHEAPKSLESAFNLEELADEIPPF